MRSSLLYTDNTHSAWLSSPFWIKGRRSPMALWALPAPEVPETQASLSLHATFGQSDGLFANPGFWGLGLSQSAQAPKSRAVVLQEMEGQRGTSRGQFWVWGPGEGPKARGLSFSQKRGDEWGCWRWWAPVQYCEGDCTTTDVPGPGLTIQITPNQSFWDFCIIKPI